MWPFKKKESEQPRLKKLPRKQIVDRPQECIDELKAFRDIGEKFNYLGATIICIGHSELDFNGLIISVRPALKGSYKNDKGEIKAISFSYRELPALKAENL